MDTHSVYPNHCLAEEHGHASRIKLSKLQPQAESSPALVFVNQVSEEHSHAHVVALCL